MEQTRATVKKISECKMEIDLVIPKDEVQQEFDKAVKRFANQAKIRGFRPGKAPSHIVKQMYLDDIKESVVNSLAPKALNDELKAHDIDPLITPVISKLSFEEGQPMQITAEIEVWPEFELPEYTKIEVHKKKAVVTEEEINQGLEDLRKRSAQYIPVEGRGVINEDYVIAEIKGKDLRTKKLLPTEKVVILAGHPENEKILNENILGRRVDEQTTFVVPYVKDHKNKKLAGKEIEYTLKVVSMKEKKLPEISDDFAKELGEFTDLKDLKAEIKAQILTAKENDIKTEMADEIISVISGRLALELPKSVVETEKLALMKRLLSNHPIHDMKKEDLDKISEEAGKKAEQNIKNHIILKRIAEKEHIAVTAENMEEEFNAIAKNNNMPLPQLKAKIDQEGRRDEIRERVVLKLTVDFLLKNAIIK
ncbi:MAG: trigger factor [Candidatus Aminicenantes bacterium]|nr:trigger factor [Candidatus Aminicenantes bacterium]